MGAIKPLKIEPSIEFISKGYYKYHWTDSIFAIMIGITVGLAIILITN